MLICFENGLYKYKALVLNSRVFVLSIDQGLDLILIGATISLFIVSVAMEHQSKLPDLSLPCRYHDLSLLIAKIKARMFI